MLNVYYDQIPFWREKFLMDDPENPGRKIEDPWVFVVGVLSMHTGINHITHKNAPEFFMRCRLIEACFDGGLMRNGKGEVVPISFDVIERFIGVRTNCTTYTEVQFFKHLRTNVVKELTRHYAYLREQQAKEITKKVLASVEEG